MQQAECDWDRQSYVSLLFKSVFNYQELQPQTSSREERPQYSGYS